MLFPRRECVSSFYFFFRSTFYKNLLVQFFFPLQRSAGSSFFAFANTPLLPCFCTNVDRRSEHRGLLFWSFDHVSIVKSWSLSSCSSLPSALRAPLLHSPAERFRRAIVIPSLKPALSSRLSSPRQSKCVLLWPMPLTNFS